MPTLGNNFGKQCLIESTSRMVDRASGLVLNEPGSTASNGRGSESDATRQIGVPNPPEDTLGESGVLPARHVEPGSISDARVEREQGPAD